MTRRAAGTLAGTATLAVCSAVALWACGKGASENAGSPGCDGGGCEGSDSSMLADTRMSELDTGATDATADGSVDGEAGAPSDGGQEAAMGLAAGFFGMTTNNQGPSHLPTVPFGGLRLWDTTAVWPRLNTDSGTYSWSDLDAWLAEAQGAGVDVMFTFGRTPQWASSAPTQYCNYGAEAGCAAPPADVDSTDQILKAFVTALVAHSVASTTAHIKYYEIWNEPDLLGTWSGTAAQLVTMGKDIASIVHQMDPSAMVVGPAPSTGNSSGIHFLPAYYDAGGAPYQDVVGMHAYIYTGSAFSSVPEGIQTTIDQLKLLTSANGVGDKPVFFTEGSWGKDTTLTSDEQVSYLAREYLLMWMNGVGRYYWYAWDSTDWGDLYDGSLLPPGTAYGQLESWLVGSSHPPTPCTQASDSTWTCLLTQSSGADAEILWNPSTSKSVSVGGAFTHVQTLADATVNAIAGGAVTVGPQPILVTK